MSDMECRGASESERVGERVAGRNAVLNCACTTQAANNTPKEDK